MKALIFKFLKFGIVGFSGMLLDFGVTFLLKEKARIHKYIANSMGFITAATNNYILNRIWTFHSNDPQIVEQYSKFILFAVIGLAINNFVIWLLSDHTFKLNFYVAKVIAIFVVFTWNFSMNYLFTFN